MTPGHPCIKLHQRLVDISSIRKMAIQHQDVILDHMKKLWLRAGRQEECAFSSIENHYSWCCMVSTTIETRVSPTSII